MNTAVKTASTKAPPPGPHIEWVAIQVRDASQLWFYDRDTTAVATVDGGWLFRFRHDAGAHSPMSVQAMSFVPDPGHHWSPKEANPRWERLGGLVNAAYNDRTARMPVYGGWVYLNTFATRGRTLSLSLVFVPDATGPA